MVLERWSYTKRKKMCVSKDKKLKTEVIRLYYVIPMGEHEEQWKIAELVMRNFWWPEVTREVK